MSNDQSKKKKNIQSRRNFLKSIGLFSGTVLSAPAIVPSSVFGENAPSNRITIGCIGVGGMGTNDMRGFISKPDSEVVAVCDIDLSHRENARKIAKFDKKSSYEDFRELLSRDDIDAVTVVTPDHWHELISISAAKRLLVIVLFHPITT